MNLISNTAVMLCICTVACILVKFLVPEGVTRKTLNLIISTVLVITMIMPIKSLFTENNKININMPNEMKISEEYNEKVLSTTKTNLEKSVKSILEQNNININNAVVTLKTDQNNGIIIESISIYITNDNQLTSSKITNLIKENFSVTQKLKQDKNLIRVIYIIGIIGIALIFCSTFFSDKSSDDTISPRSISDYQSTQETRIKDMVESIEGVGNAKVMITMENSAEQIYTDDTKVKEIEPAVRGVLVICTGANNPEIKETVLESVTKTLNISSDKVCITKLKEK